MLTDLLTVKLDRLQIYEKLYELVEGAVMVNNQNIERKSPPPAQEVNLLSQEVDGPNVKVSPFKTPAEKQRYSNMEQEESKSDQKSRRSSSESENQNLTTFFSQKGTDVYRTSLNTKTTEKLYTI